MSKYAVLGGWFPSFEIRVEVRKQQLCSEMLSWYAVDGDHSFDDVFQCTSGPRRAPSLGVVRARIFLIKPWKHS